MRNGLQDKSRFQIGTDSIVSGRFVLETPDSRIRIGNRTFIGGGQFIAAQEIEIGSDVLISWGCTFIDTNAHSIYWKDRADDVKDWHKGLKENKIGKYKDWSRVTSKKITIKDKAWIGFDCKILKGVTIGEGAIIGAGSVVSTDVEAFCVYAGNPAVKIKEINK